MAEQRPLDPLLSGLTAHAAAPAGPLEAQIEPEELLAILAAARVAPSADNAQTWRFIVVRTSRTRAEISRAVPEELAGVVAEAPLVIVACGVRWFVTRTRREQPFVMIDVPIALTHMLLAAQELGLHYAWTLVFDEERIREILSIPPDVRVIGLLALGRSEGRKG